MKCAWCGQTVTMSFEVLKNQVCKKCFEQWEEECKTQGIDIFVSHNDDLDKQERKKAVKIIIKVFPFVLVFPILAILPVELAAVMVIIVSVIISVLLTMDRIDGIFGGASLFPELAQTYDIIGNKNIRAKTIIAIIFAALAFLFFAYQSHKHHKRTPRQDKTGTVSSRVKFIKVVKNS